MATVLILGAHGRIARLVEEQLERDHPQTRQILFLRNARRLGATKGNQTVIEGDATDGAAVTRALVGVDIVYANLAGDNIETQATTIVSAMEHASCHRLVWISTLGIYNEVPGAFGQFNNATLGNYLTTYAAAAKVIENSSLDYTVIRPAWLTNKNAVDYELTQKGTPFAGTEVSRSSVADLVVSLIEHPEQHVRESLGVNQPHTEGPKPAWYR